VDIVAVVSIEVNIVAVAGSVEDNLVGCPGTENHDTGFEQRSQYYIEIDRLVVDIVDVERGIHDPKVHHQNRSVLERKGTTDSGYWRAVGPVGYEWMGCCTGTMAVIPNLAPFHRNRRLEAGLS